MSDEKTNIAPGETPTLGGPVNVAEIAAKHQPDPPKRKRNIVLEDGRKVPRDSEEGLAFRARERAGEVKSSGMASGMENSLSPLAREQVVAAIKSLIKVIDGRVQMMVGRTAYKITRDKDFAKQVVVDVAMQEIEADTMTSLTVIVLEKYNVLGTYAPEALLACAVIGYGWRVHSTIREIKQLAAEQHDKANATNIDQNTSGRPTGNS